MEPQFYPLEKHELYTNPFQQFRSWFAEAQARSGMLYPNAFTLSTIGENGAPDSRIVLMKGLDDRGFTFFTNFTSAKGRALATTPKASMVFYWDKLNRQIRVRGDVEDVVASEADEYFATRPRDSQLAAWSSLQSQPMAEREEMEQRFAELSEKYAGTDIPRPPYWSGKRIIPTAFEFWQERKNRMHDRFAYRHNAGNHWDIIRLYP